MNREIKFRQPIFGRDSKFIRWHYWGFVKKGEVTAPITGRGTLAQVEKESCQYINLKDKNGKEIYEGDILKPIMLSTWEKQLYLVIYSGTSFVFKGLQFNTYDTITNSQITQDKDREIIGNIYENPELLEGADNES